MNSKQSTTLSLDKFKLTRYLTKLGVTFNNVSASELAHINYNAWGDDRPRQDRYQAAPFATGVGIIWSSKTIVHTSGVEWPALLHEAGHLLTEKYLVDDGRNDCEDGFLGWEWAVVRKLRLDRNTYLRNNKDYGICWDDTESGGAYYSTMGDVPPKLIGKYFRDRVKWAKHIGIVSADGEPLVVERA